MNQPNQPVPEPNEPVDAATCRQVVETVIREMGASYVFPEVAAKVSVMLARNLAEQAYDGIHDPVALAARLTDDLQATTLDKHVRVLHSAEPIPEPRESPDEPSPEDEELFRRQVEEANYGVERVERLPLNVGYVDISGFKPAFLAGEAISAAMSLVAHARALIVDLRRNGGGDPATVALTTSYLLDQSTHLNDIYWREGDRTDQFWTLDWVPGRRFGQSKPVYVLTSRSTFSAAEEFAYNLKSLERATLVGEMTRGGAHPGRTYRLATHFRMKIPRGRSINPITGTNWEGVGVEPDVKVPAADALRIAQVLALRAIAEHERDAGAARMLRERITELEAMARSPIP